MIQHPLFIEISKFEDWARDQLADPSRISAEWEVDYTRWSDIKRSFSAFMDAAPASSWSSEELEKLVYIIARDNECQRLIKCLSDEALVRLSEQALVQGEQDCKWQLANELPRIADKRKAIELIERFVNDPEEYVNRRALIALSVVDASRTEYYCIKHWERTIYGDMDEYQRMAILDCLKHIGSPLLRSYLARAKEDGGTYLLMNALDIEKEISGHP